MWDTESRRSPHGLGGFEGFFTLRAAALCPEPVRRRNPAC